LLDTLWAIVLFLIKHCQAEMDFLWPLHLSQPGFEDLDGQVPLVVLFIKKGVGKINLFLFKEPGSGGR
jgi:hypothetical protein